MTTDQNIIALAKAKVSGSPYPYAFGFVWAMLTKEQKEELDKWAVEMLAEMDSN